MTKDDDCPFSCHCEPIDVTNSPLDEDHSTAGVDLQKLQETRKLKQLKLFIRTSYWGISHPIRKELWKHSLEAQECSVNLLTEEDYWNICEQLFGSRDVENLNAIDISRKHMETSYPHHLLSNYHLNDQGIQACCRIVPIFLEMRATVSHCRMLYAITALLLHYMEEVEAFKCLDRMVGSKTTFITSSKVTQHGVVDGLKTMAKIHEKNAYTKLSRLNLPENEEVFADWDKWIFCLLPFPVLIRVMDCYFCEGIKLFYRTCITCFNYCMKDVSENPTTGSALTTDGFARAMELFLPNLQKTPKQFLNKCFKIRKFSSGEIGRILSESTDRSMGHDLTMGAQPQPVRAFEEEPQSFSPEVESDLLRMAHTATIPDFMLIWKQLPMRVQLCSPTLIFTTGEHGSSLRTLYRLTEMYSPLLLLIKDHDEHVFGAYCSHPLRERNSKDEYMMHQFFFGNGETFVFTLKPVFQPFKWVGIRMQTENPTLSSIDRTFQLFMHADNDELMIGGGLDRAAIQFDKDLRFGRSSPSPTFDSPILSKSDDFSIKVLEIYSITDK